MRIFKLIPLITAATLALSPVALFAHAKMVSSTPAANATVAKPPMITLTFNEKLTGPTVKVELFMTAMPSGMKHEGEMDHSKMGQSAMADHAPVKIAATSQLGKNGDSVTLTPKRGLTAGKYKVSWTAAGADKHEISGSYSFTVK